MTRLTALLFLAASACASATGDELVTAGAPRTFFVSPSDSSVTVAAALDHDGVTDTGVADLAIDEGTVDVSLAGDVIVVDDLSLALHDIRLPAAIYPGDIVLTDVHVDLTGPSRDLVLTWSAVIEGRVHPLAPQTLTGFDVAVSVDDDDRAVDLLLTHDGELWTYLGVARLADATVSIRTFDAPPVEIP